MPKPRPHLNPDERDRCLARLRDVNSARAHLQAARHEVARNWEERRLRAELLVALEGFAAAITKLGGPIPHKVRTEIDLCRRLSGRS
jgi:hypothetical protein